MKNKNEAEYIKISKEADELFSSGKKTETEKLLQYGLTLAVKNNDLAYIEFFKGELALIEDKYKDFLAHHIKAVSLDSENPFLLKNLGVAYSWNNLQEEAINYYDKALEIKPDDYDSLRNKGVSFIRMNKAKEALKYFDKALEINPDDYHSLGQKGVAFSKINKEEEAIKCYDKALKINPENYNSLRDKGVALSKMRKDEEAIKYFDKALKINPDDYDSLRQKGVSFSNMNKKQEAIEYFDKALVVNPDDYDSLLAKALILEERGMIKEAKEIIESLIKSIDFINDKRAIDFIKFKASYFKSKESGHTKSSDKSSDVLSKIISSFYTSKENLFNSIENIEKEFKSFTDTNRSIPNDYPSFLSVLRKWNSYTPILPSVKGDNKGGGYFLYHKGKGMVIDPGFNFIDNFYEEGFKVADIDAVLITHAHNDHTVDLESILTLVYKYNESIKDEIKENYKNENKEIIDAKCRLAIKEKGKKIDLYLNLGTFMKYSGWLNLKDSEEINSVTVLQPNTTYNLSSFNNVTLYTTKSKHHEVIDNKYVIGLIFDIDGNKIAFTGDTGWDYENKAAFLKPYLEHKPKLLIAHLGSIKRNEFDYVNKTTEEERNSCFYKHHLGLLGITNLLYETKPELTVISEFGEELREFRRKIVEGIEEVLKLKCLPGDIGLHINLKDLKVFCFINEDFVEYNSIQTYDDLDKQTICFHQKEDDHGRFNIALKKKNAMRAIPFWQRKNK